MLAHRSHTTLAARLLAAALFALLAVATPQALAGGADQLDPTFGANGIAKVAFPGYADTKAMAVQPDGKIVLAGMHFVNSSGLPEALAVARVNSDGTPDLSFGQGGKLVLSAVGLMRADAVTIQDDGKIVLAGVTAETVGGTGRLLIVRLTAGGTPDATFNGNGIFSTLISGESASAATVAALPGGKILAAGSRGPGAGHNLVAVRVTNAGALDSGFDGDGMMDVPLDVVPADSTPWRGWATSSTVTSNGSVLIAGSRSNYPPIVGQMFVAKINASGALDAGFGYNGRAAVTQYGTIEGANGIAVTPEGKILLAGSTTESSSQAHPVVQQLKSDGSPDTSFGVGGRQTLSIAGQGVLNSVALDPQGGIVTGGINLISDNPWTTAPIVGKSSPGGLPDTAFGDNQGSIALRQLLGLTIRTVATAPGNKILAAGSFTDGLTVVRLAPPAPIPVPLSTTISKPKSAKSKAKKFRLFAGTAAGDRLAKVQIAVIKSDSKLLKKKRCLQLKNNQAKLSKFKAAKKKCSPSKWLTATGTTSWNYRLKKALKPGKYTLYVRSVNTSGAKQATPFKKRFTLTK